MNEHRVVFRGIDIFGHLVPSAQPEISFNILGTSWRPLTPDERKNGVKVDPNSPFVARISREHYWTVEQAMVVVPAASPRLVYLNPVDFGSDTLVGTAYSSAPQDGVFQHVFTAWLTRFREAESARAANGCEPIPSWPLNSLVFSGADVLRSGGSGWGRFAGQIQPVPCFGPGVGKLRFAHTPDSTVPQLSALYIPDGLDLTQPVPMNIFFTPSTGGNKNKKPPYPFSHGPNSFNDMLMLYLTNGMHRLVHQSIASRRKCIFAFLLPPPVGYYDGVVQASNLRLYCQELAFWLKKDVGTRRWSDPDLGHCALSAFSEGGKPLHTLVTSDLSGSLFPELLELYCLDVVSPAGSSTNTASYGELVKSLSQWVKTQASRRVRIYTEYSHFDAFQTNPFKVPVPRSNGGAQEHQTNQATFVYTPVDSFWETVKTEQASTQPNPDYLLNTSDDVHHLMPCVFMEHALSCSGFAKL